MQGRKAFPLCGKNYDNGLNCFPVKSNKNSPSAKIWEEKSSGAKLVGVIALAVGGPNCPEAGTNTFHICPTISVNAKSGYTVNKIKQTFSYISNSGNAPGKAVHLKTVVNALFTVASAIASLYGIPVINPFDLLQHGTPNTKFVNSFSKCYNAGQEYNKGLGREVYNTLGTTYYNWNWPFEHFQPSYMFGFIIRTWFGGSPYYDHHNINNPVAIKFEYSVSLYLTNKYGLFHTTTTIYFNAGEYK